MIPMTILCPVRVIGVASAEDIAEVVVLRRVRILVVGDDGDRRAGRDPLEDARENLCAVLLAARSCDLGLANAAAIELELDFLDRQWDAGGAAFDHDAQ